jgi:hypothetical protein
LAQDFWARRLITMARRRQTPEQIIRKLREDDRLLAEGVEAVSIQASPTDSFDRLLPWAATLLRHSGERVSAATAQVISLTVDQDGAWTSVASSPSDTQSDEQKRLAMAPRLIAGELAKLAGLKASGVLSGEAQR